MNTRISIALLFVIAASTLLVAGCSGSSQVTQGGKPEDNMNPAMSAHQKSVLAGRAKKDDN